ncbi:IS4 family transposase [Virgibacillus dakarensis]|uniref:IS4 family transposase n=1 Tax=Virgibacillus dakarensis TaxID=1917889 RepID=UPI001356648A|nr:IS4 family transposase [Virgibacillus dakarensis]MBT2218630.1 IS4 family transposase [Virgibacillus dakarensis]MBT2218631.1 IS4 family transposase [Virgibacillus dakarensis]
MSTKVNVENEFELFAREMERKLSSEQIRQLAKEVDFMQRSTKLKPEYFCQLCSILGESFGNKSLTQLCAQLCSYFNLEISAEGLNQRFNEESVEFMRRIFQSLWLNQVSGSLPFVERHLFKRIRILDSSSFDLPSDYTGYDGPNGTGVKIQLEYELYEGVFRHLQIQNGKESDISYAKSIQDDIQPGDLCLRDLGYFSQDNLLAIDKKGGYYVSRIRNQTNLYQKNDDGQWQKINVTKMMEPLQPGEVIELTQVRVGAKTKDPLLARIVVTKLTEEQKEKRQEHLNQKKKRRKKSLSAQKNISVNIFATNIPQEQVKKEEIYPLYSLRWQIEILFKTWKSLFEIQKVKKMKKERFECHLYGTLIQLLICSTVAFQCRRMLYQQYHMEVSEYKSIDIAKESLTVSQQGMIDKGRSLVEVLKRIYKSIRMNGRKCHKKQKKTVFDILHIAYKQSISPTA